MAPFVNHNHHSSSHGPEGEIGPAETYELKVLFCPSAPGLYHCTLPIVVNNNFDRPYYYIDVRGELLVPELFFEPACLTLRPVPLGMEARERLCIKQRGYHSASKLTLNVDKAKCLDGTWAQVLHAEFVREGTEETLPGAIIVPDKPDVVEVSLRFVSAKPVATTLRLTLTDEQGKEYACGICVTADNSLFTCYAFLADHQSDYHIVLEPGRIMKGSRITAGMNSEQKTSAVSASEAAMGEPLLRPFTGTSKYSNGRTVSPTFDMNAAVSRAGRSPVRNYDDANTMQAMFNGEHGGGGGGGSTPFNERLG